MPALAYTLARNPKNGNAQGSSPRASIVPSIAIETAKATFLTAFQTDVKLNLSNAPTLC